MLRVYFCNFRNQSINSENIDRTESFFKSISPQNLCMAYIQIDKLKEKQPFGLKMYN